MTCENCPNHWLGEQIRQKAVLQERVAKNRETYNQFGKISLKDFFTRDSPRDQLFQQLEQDTAQLSKLESSVPNKLIAQVAACQGPFTRPATTGRPGEIDSICAAEFFYGGNTTVYRLESVALDDNASA